MDHPYRDEVVALREENERLRRLVRQGRRRRPGGAAVAGLALGAASVFALDALLPLLNAPSDGRFALGVLGALAIFAIDLGAVLVIASRAAPPDPDAPSRGR